MTLQLLCVFLWVMLFVGIAFRWDREEHYAMEFMEPDEARAFFESHASHFRLSFFEIILLVALIPLTVWNFAK